MLPFLAAFVLASQADPRLVGSSRSDAGGWVELHLAGKPRDIGFQYGYLAGKEIDDAHRAKLSQLTGPHNWTFYRETAKTIFWPKVDTEYRQEMAGQADGLAARGYSYDVWDVLAYNAFIEIGDYYVPWLASHHGAPVTSGAGTSCSAFIANGSYTRDGRIVMGHSLWWDYLMGERANILLDIKPERGQRVLMDAFAGFIHSGSDFAINSAGITLCETTIAGFAGFDPEGVPEFVRMRKAIQYSKSIDDVVRIFKDGNNGGYANTWLIGDLTANRIGKLELGLKDVDVHTTNDGYYCGSNFPESPQLIKDEVPGGWDADPARNGCEDRHIRWIALLTKNRGQIDAEMAKAFLADNYDEARHRSGRSDSTLCGMSCNAKVVTAAMVENWQIWARMGEADGVSINLGASENPFLHPIPGEPWTLVSAK